MHTQQYISVRDLIENPLFLFLGVRLGFLGVLLGFCIFFFFYILPPAQNPPHFHFHRRPKESRFGSTRRPQNAEANLSSKEESTRSHPYRPNAPGLGPRALLFFFVESQHLSLERKRERREEHTRRRGGLGFVSLEKEDAAFGRARLRASVEQLSSLSLIRSREI